MLVYVDRLPQQRRYQGIAHATKQDEKQELHRFYWAANHHQFYFFIISGLYTIAMKVLLQNLQKETHWGP